MNDAHCHFFSPRFFETLARDTGGRFERMPPRAFPLCSDSTLQSAPRRLPIAGWRNWTATKSGEPRRSRVSRVMKNPSPRQLAAIPGGSLATSWSIRWPLMPRRG